MGIIWEWAGLLLRVYRQYGLPNNSCGNILHVVFLNSMSSSWSLKASVEEVKRRKAWAVAAGDPILV
jgi:hypothetical protein